MAGMTTSEPRATSGRAATPRAKSTALRIERSAVDLVNEHGYEGTTVDMICAEAHVSQRTFFNHFPTKDAAIVGNDEPRLDERLARVFIASDSPSILADAVDLIAGSTSATSSDPSFMLARMKAVSSSPALVQRQMERFSSMEDDVAEVLSYRIARVSPGLAEEDIRDQAVLAAHLLAGVMRHIAAHAMGRDPRDLVPIIERTKSLLGAVLPQLA